MYEAFNVNSSVGLSSDARRISEAWCTARAHDDATTLKVPLLLYLVPGTRYRHTPVRCVACSSCYLVCIYWYKFARALCSRRLLCAWFCCSVHTCTHTPAHPVSLVLILTYLVDTRINRDFFFLYLVRTKIGYVLIVLLRGTIINRTKYCW